jgi:SPP1 gp7 family putative phage head morphogenesis protein
MASYFAQDIKDRTDAQMKSMLKKSGLTVKFNITPAMRDIMKATVAENVSLIKSIPQEYLKNVEGAVMRSVQVGRDLGALSKELRTKFGVSKRRAALIARDQNNKATSAFQRARQVELGITEAIWMHSHAGKKPRRTHVAMNGKRYDVKQGMWDSDEKEYVFPGQLINCRCTSKSVIQGFS